MRIKAIILISALFLSKFSYSQTCENSYFQKNGTSIEITEFDAKNNAVSNKKVYTISDVKTTPNGTTSKVRSIKTEQNGTVSEDRIITYKCTADGVLWVYDENDTKTKQPATINYPAVMENGQDLKTNVNFEFSAKTPEGQKAKLTIKINNRIVVGKEKVSIKVGTWVCTKITYDFYFKLKIGIIGLPIEAKVTEWYNPEVGVVRSETYVKGQKANYAEITSIK